MSDYESFRERKLRQNAETRAQETGIFDILFWVHTGNKTVPAWIKQAVQETQRVFFLVNPKRIHPDATIFRSGLEMLARDYPLWRENVTEFRSILVRNAMRIIESQIATDIFYAKK